MEVFHIENPKAWNKHTDTSDIYIYIKYILMNVEHHIYIKYILMIVEQLHLHKIHIDECGTATFT